MGVVVEYPIIVHIDNVVGLLLSENISASQQRKRIGVNHHFIPDHVEDGTVKIKCVHSEGNITDPLTKNRSNGPFQSLISRYVNCEWGFKSFTMAISITQKLSIPCH